MHLVLLPLTYKGEEEKQTAIRESVELARQIPDKNVETFILSGILAFTDKVINEKTRNHIKEVLSMTQVGKMLVVSGSSSFLCVTKCFLLSGQIAVIIKT